MKRDQQITLSLIAAGFLLFSLVDGLPYGYFTFLRFIVCIIGIYLALSFHKAKINQMWIWIFVLISVLFNPIVPIYLDRSQWVLFDFIVGVLFLVSLSQTRKIT